MSLNNIKELIGFGKTLNILFIEDNNEVRIQIHKLLQNFFSNIEIAVDGNEAYEKYNDYYKKNNHYYDIVISDLNLPKLDGIELCSMIINKNPEQLILVISAHTESDKLMKLIEIGIYKFLQKPIQYENFIDTISKVLNKKKEEKETLKLKDEITTIKHENIHLSKLATIDKLTQLYNRHYIDKILLNEFSSKNISNYFSIILIDIDDFKKINDKYGHVIGDVILKDFAKLIKESIRNEDILGRWGGEEFIIVSQNTNIETSILIAHKLKRIIENTKFSNDIFITSSFGVSEYENNDTITSLIKRADIKLYLSKTNGKNLVSF